MKSWATQEFSRLSEERVMMAPLYSRPPLSRLFDAEAQLAGLPAPAEAIRQSAETRIGLRFKTMKPVLMRQTFCDFDRYLVGVTADPVVGSQDGDPSSVRARAYNRKRGRFSSSAYCYLIDRATGLAVDLTRAALAAKDSNATLQPMPQAAPVGQ